MEGGPYGGPRGKLGWQGGGTLGTKELRFQPLRIPRPVRLYSSGDMCCNGGHRRHHGSPQKANESLMDQKDNVPGPGTSGTGQRVTEERGEGWCELRDLWGTPPGRGVQTEKCEAQERDGATPPGAPMQAEGLELCPQASGSHRRAVCRRGAGSPLGKDPRDHWGMGPEAGRPGKRLWEEDGA